MRLDRVYVDGFKNLRRLEVNFDEERLTTVIIGQNGTGKSNLIEAITAIFRSVDLRLGPVPFEYEIDYRLAGATIRLSNRAGADAISVNGEPLSRAAFERERASVFPDLIFGYYSGGSRRLERLFDDHQRGYYRAIKRNDDPEECRQALERRRLFYCRPIHGTFATLASLAFSDSPVNRLLRERLGVTGFHSALAHFKEPWFASGSQASRLRDSKSLWGAKGPAGRCARALHEAAFLPMSLQGNPVDDYRDRPNKEAQLACYLRDEAALRAFSGNYADEREVFTALEAADISGLFRALNVWVTRVGDASGDVGFADLSDGERQLLMVLGLIRVSAGKTTLFLLDEPDTHLNPEWQHSYLDTLQRWVGALGDPVDCQIVMTSHNPLTIAGLERQDVRVMSTRDDGSAAVSVPYTDPRGMGFTSVLTEIFGLSTTLDSQTQRLVDERNGLARLERLSTEQERQLVEINDKLSRFGFMFEDREPLYRTSCVHGTTLNTVTVPRSPRATSPPGRRQ